MALLTRSGLEEIAEPPVRVDPELLKGEKAKVLEFLSGTFGGSQPSPR